MDTSNLVKEIDDFMNTSCPISSAISMPFDLTDSCEGNVLAVESSFELSGAGLVDWPCTQVLPDESDDSTFESPQEAEARQDREKLRRRKQRLKAKNERTSLKRMVHELSVEVKRLKLSKEAQALLKMKATNSFMGSLVDWQRQERLRVEAEQRRLVDAARVQASYIEHLHRLVHGHSQIEPDTGMGNVASPTTSVEHKPPSSVDSTEVALWMALLREADACYARVDDIIRDCGIAELPDGVTNSVHRRNTDGEVNYYQFLNKLTLPFKFDQTEKAVWKMAELRHRQQDRQVIEGLADPQNTTMLRFRLRAAGGKVSLLERFVARRYLESNRAVYTWKISTEGEGKFSGLHSDETGVCILRPSVDGFSSTSEICMRQVPKCFDKVELGGLVAEECRRLLQHKVVEDERERTSAVQTELLKGVLTFTEWAPAYESNKSNDLPSDKHDGAIRSRVTSFDHSVLVYCLSEQLGLRSVWLALDH